MDYEHSAYDRIEIILHAKEDDDDIGIYLTDGMLSNVDSEDFDWWYDHEGNCHMQFWTAEAAIIGAELLKDMAKGEHVW